MQTTEVDVWFLFCESPQESGLDGMDFVRLLWNDEEVWHGELATGENWGSHASPTPHVTRTLNGPATLQLIVRPTAEGSVPDLIGAVALDPQNLTVGQHSANFDVRGAKYEISYEARRTETPPQPGPTKEVDVWWLFCESPQESGPDGMDFVRLLWNDEEVWHGELATGENWGSHASPTPHVIRTLNGPATLQLIVRPTAEGSVPDLIGALALDPQNLTVGQHSANFDVRGAKYEITFKVQEV